MNNCASRIKFLKTNILWIAYHLRKQQNLWRFKICARTIFLWFVLVSKLHGNASVCSYHIAQGFDGGKNLMHGAFTKLWPLNFDDLMVAFIGNSYFLENIWRIIASHQICHFSTKFALNSKLCMTKVWQIKQKLWMGNVFPLSSLSHLVQQTVKIH